MKAVLDGSLAPAYVKNISAIGVAPPSSSHILCTYWVAVLYEVIQRCHRFQEAGGQKVILLHLGCEASPTRAKSSFPESSRCYDTTCNDDPGLLSILNGMSSLMFFYSSLPMVLNINQNANPGIQSLPSPLFKPSLPPLSVSVQRIFSPFPNPKGLETANRFCSPTTSCFVQIVKNKSISTQTSSIKNKFSSLNTCFNHNPGKPLIRFQRENESGSKRSSTREPQAKPQPAASDKPPETCQCKRNTEHGLPTFLAMRINEDNLWVRKNFLITGAGRPVRRISKGEIALRIHQALTGNYTTKSLQSAPLAMYGRAYGSPMKEIHLQMMGSRPLIRCDKVTREIKSPRQQAPTKEQPPRVDNFVGQPEITYTSNPEQISGKKSTPERVIQNIAGETMVRNLFPLHKYPSANDVELAVSHHTGLHSREAISGVPSELLRDAAKIGLSDPVHLDVARLGLVDARSDTGIQLIAPAPTPASSQNAVDFEVSFAGDSFEKVDRVMTNDSFEERTNAQQLLSDYNQKDIPLQPSNTEVDAIPLQIKDSVTLAQSKLEKQHMEKCVSEMKSLNEGQEAEEKISDDVLQEDPDVSNQPRSSTSSKRVLFSKTAVKVLDYLDNEENETRAKFGESTDNQLMVASGSADSQVIGMENVIVNENALLNDGVQ